MVSYNKAIVDNTTNWTNLTATMMIWKDNGLLLEVDAEYRTTEDIFARPPRNETGNVTVMQIEQIGGINLVLRRSNYLDKLFGKEEEEAPSESPPLPSWILVLATITVLAVAIVITYIVARKKVN